MAKETEQEIVNRIMNTQGKMAHYLKTHACVCVSVSGGSDSDCIVHMIATYFREYLPKIHFVFSNTGLEYKATKEHLKYIEEKYDIKIKRLGVADGVVPIPKVIQREGVPFLSKMVSENICSLQDHGFDFLNYKVDDVDYLHEKFGKCKTALRWWCNASGRDYTSKSFFNINRNKYLKDFMLLNPINFKTSAKCCKLSKKEPLLSYYERMQCDLNITGQRKCEGGVRSVKPACFYARKDTFDLYNPLFFWSNDCKQYYKEHEGIRYSDCYEVWGMERTGCCGCPFNLHLEEDLSKIREYEPKLYNACMRVFGKSYEFTAKYRQFQKECKDAETERKLKLKVKGE